MGGFISRPKPAPAPRPEPKPVSSKLIEQPAVIEAKRDYDEKKRKGRRSTIFNSNSGVSDELELAKKTLLGG